MRRKTRTKIQKYLKISAIIIGIILLTIGIILLIIKLKQTTKVSYEDGIVGKNYFVEISINLNNKKVKRDDHDTTLVEEFGITKEQEELIFSSEEDRKNIFSNSCFDITINNGILKITNQYQTKCFMVKAKEIKEKVEGEEIQKIADNLFLLSFYSEKLTKAMYNYYKNQAYIENVYLDEVYIDNPINDISQTMYGETPVDLKGNHYLGTIKHGLDNYKNIINENGNPYEITIATIGYGVDYQNEYIKERIGNNYYNFILNNKDISETIPQGSRIAEVLIDTTTNNVKIMPLVTVTSEGYVSISSILKAFIYSIENADVICYELVNKKSDTIDIILQEAFNNNKPVCAVSLSEQESYLANNEKTIAVSSLDRNDNLEDFSAIGKYIDFAVSSTDVEEIFKSNSTVSRWSGPEYSNASITAMIALAKTYHKDATILEIYNFLRDFCVDLGEKGKDENFGYGAPVFSNLKISDLDKKNPEIKETIFDNEKWEVIKQIRILATDNIRIYKWAITQDEQQPKEEEWNVLETLTPNLDVTYEITENGKYYIWIQDSAGNNIKKEIQLDKIDNKPPQIAYTINKDTVASGYVTIKVTAEDTESGLNDNTFSWDNMAWSQENSTRIVKQNGRYKVYARDKLDNISELEIIVDAFPQEGKSEIGDGNIITSIFVSADWNENTNNNVQIKLNKDINIIGWQITTSIYQPNEFVKVDNNNNNNSNTTNNTNNGINQNMTTRSMDNINSINTNTNKAIPNISIPQNIVWNQSENTNSQNNNSINQNNSNINQNNNNVVQNNSNQAYQRNEPIVIKASLDINKTYYLWIKDSQQNVRYQTFKIMKAEI